MAKLPIAQSSQTAVESDLLCLRIKSKAAQVVNPSKHIVLYRKHISFVRKSKILILLGLVAVDRALRFFIGEEGDRGKNPDASICAPALIVLSRSLAKLTSSVWLYSCYPARSPVKQRSIELLSYILYIASDRPRPLFAAAPALWH
ncbi:MAG: hypothetical protein EAZ60_22390 [Oscillatoriales cyanobacterium]|nr:MAG: hypothetical protein EAZ83_24485 [Oscillatoriales cyanobacterium]TAF16884.1 MAG: hypothetical protein EAZ73_23330 [Oscillatoriales cyanobacterium]TAF34849.1 MAG: hypothetical protein EAZ69_14415 [Oscillatoriales cyanobacterium]TAF52802.1 MAG: hypothetical protein EAZ60_22390 [Oscillatoriales cyanobacterium]